LALQKKNALVPKLPLKEPANLPSLPTQSKKISVKKGIFDD
jgi:hypothetical protein